MAQASPLEIHPFMADRYAQAVVPAAMILVVDHDRRPLDRLRVHCEKADKAWMDLEALRVALDDAAKAVAHLPLGQPPDELIAVHTVGKDARTGRDCIADPPEWALALNRVAATFCVATKRTSGWNPHMLEAPDDQETLEKFAEAAKKLHPPAFEWYAKLASGLLAWMQGGALRGFLTGAETELFRNQLEATPDQMFMWKEKGADFHRRKLQAFCHLANKNRLGLAAVERR